MKNRNKNYHKKLQERFNLAIECPPEERLTFLEEVCSDDPEMLSELRRLVSYHFGAASDFLEESPVLTPTQVHVGQEVCGYKLLDLIGRGGMADVYRARRLDGVFKNDVALKVVNQIANCGDLADRLHNERLILSNLKHPYIANLLDGGSTPDGAPFYVMDFVRGVDILSHSQQHGLSIRDRVRLFIKVCDGVSVAHRNLIIHRDLKPSNIMVTADGEPKLLDFGIAKDMTISSNTTSMLPMTPRYASPEQLRAEILTTATDIYSLGVILYEVLTGVSPYSAETPVELIHEISEIEPRPMREKSPGRDSNVNRALSGDLDKIVMKAMHKDADMRYSSVQQFSDDLFSYLENKPVMARADSLLYRSNRFIRRNRAAVLFVGLALAIFVAQQFRVISERDIAELERDATAQERDKLQQTKEFLVGIFEISEPGPEQGNSITARELLDRGLEDIEESLEGQPEIKSELMTTMGVVYRELGLYDTSLALLQDAVQLRRSEGLDRSGIPNELIGTAESLSEYGASLVVMGEYEDAEEVLLQAVDIYSGQGGDEQPGIAVVYDSLSDLYSESARFAEALHYLQLSLGIRLATMGEDDPDIAESYAGLGYVYSRMGEFQESIDHFQQALTVVGESEKSRNVLSIYNGLGIGNWELNRRAEALGYFETNLSIAIEIYGSEHPIVATIYQNLGNAYTSLEDFPKAIEYFNQSLAIRLPLLGQDHLEVATIYTGIAFAYAQQGRYDEAIAYYEEVAETFRETDKRLFAANYYNNYGSALVGKQQYARAISILETALNISMESLGEDHYVAASTLQILGRAYQGRSELETAITYYQRSYSIRQDKLGPEHPLTFEVKHELDETKELTR